MKGSELNTGKELNGTQESELKKISYIFYSLKISVKPR